MGDCIEFIVADLLTIAKRLDALAAVGGDVAPGSPAEVRHLAEKIRGGREAESEELARQWMQRAARVGLEVAGADAVSAALLAGLPQLERLGAALHRVLTREGGHDVADVLGEYARDGQTVVWREPFRWHTREGVIPNAYEMLSLYGVADLMGARVIVDCGCAGIVVRASALTGRPVED